MATCLMDQQVLRTSTGEEAVASMARGRGTDAASPTSHIGSGADILVEGQVAGTAGLTVKSNAVRKHERYGEGQH